jgi:hypothetical protein
MIPFNGFTTKWIFSTLLSYNAAGDIANLKHLGHLSDSVLEEYAEETE